MIGLVWLLGCAEGPPAHDDTDVAAVQSDTGASLAHCDARPLEATLGPALVLDRRLQGGWVLETGVDVVGVRPKTMVELGWRVEVPDGGWVLADGAPGQHTVHEFVAADCSAAVLTTGTAVSMGAVPGDDDVARGCSLEGQTLHIELTVSDGDDQATATLEAPVVVAHEGC